MHDQVQPTAQERVKDYDLRICVNGTRGYSDYDQFSGLMADYVKYHIPANQSFIFVTGAAPSGADTMIIRWCIERGYEWSEFPANWDDIDAPGAVVRLNRFGKPYNKKAGFIRNSRMANVCNRLVSFYDGVSSGTKHMIAEMVSRGFKPTIVVIETDKEAGDGRQQKSSDRRDPDVRRENPAW